MDLERSRIEEDLKGQLDGEIRCDDAFLRLYSSDASIYEIQPLAVVRPFNRQDVVACVNYARENQIPIVPRGSGSNVVGSAIGQAIILDFSYAMRRIVSADRETVTVEPGVVLAELNQGLQAHNRKFGPDPSSRRISTMGGVLSMNSSGSHWLTSGTPRDKVERLRVVMATGQEVVFDASRSSSTVSDLDPEAVRLEQRVEQILERHAKAIDQARPNTRVNQAGYNLFDLAGQHGLDLTRLLTGSEGTLAIITEAVLRTDPQPRHRGVALLFFHRLEDAAKAAVEISTMGVAACDLMDRRLLTLATETNEKYVRLIPTEAEAMLLVEFEANDHARLTDQLQTLVQRIQRKRKLAFEVRVTTQTDDRNLFWRLTRRVIPTLYRLKGSERALPFVEDMAVDPAMLPEFLNLIHRVLNENEITASIFAHAPQGLVHVRPFLDLSDLASQEKMRRLADSLFDNVINLGGSISGAHGDGLSRTWALRRQFGPVYDVFREVKQVFDPQNILNPGKIVDEGRTGLTDDLRRVTVSREPVVAGEGNSALPVLQPMLQWGEEDIALAARNCNGCGRCRTSYREERMCPIFRLAPREEASPRAKANLMRAVMTGQLAPESLTQEDTKAIADLCVNCHQCRLECPAGVDIPKLMVEAKAQYFATNGLKLSDWLLTRLDWLYEIAGRMPRLVNVLIRNRFFRATLDRFFGIASTRKLPSFDHRSFARWASKNNLTRPSRQQERKVVYFVDAFVNWNDTELGRAFVNVLKHNGIEVLVPPKQQIAGMSLISDGAISRARRFAAKNVELLAEWVRLGYQVVVTEPSAALAISHEYQSIVEDEDARLVAENTMDACSYLWQLHQQGDLELDFKPVNASVGYHLPCHQRALGPNAPAVRLMRLVPGLQVEWMEKGCSGMAGTWGLKRKNYLRSLKMGLSLINAIRSPTIQVGSTECSTCKMQMEQGTTKPTIHPIKILAMAYGLMPELEDLFNRQSEELVIT
ncbi:MAG: anaerobic glycerol-3-phosphate dehydrogenase subunit C [Planctomycetota bacterium]|nr:anaerobic glycerol-3-phosphate dehydrogenase subunit C [Planctomycetota bacterium]